jgi:hypothetical protein
LRHQVEIDTADIAAETAAGFRPKPICLAIAALAAEYAGADIGYSFSKLQRARC